MLIDQVRTYCTELALFEPGLVVVGVSGGPDSLTLLHVLRALQDELQIALHVATFDHQLRGEESADDSRFVCEIARSWSIQASAGAANVAALAREWSMGIEAAARRARYTFLAEVAQQVGARQIALGHNQADQAETVLMHVIRGAGLTGLRGMLPKTRLTGAHPDLVIVRPLLETPRADIEAYIRELGIQPRLDRTNADRSYIRNRLRHDIMPLLEAINPQVRAALARTGQLARDDLEALQRCLPPMQQRGAGISIGRAEFLELPAGQQRLWIRLAAQQFAPALELGFEQTLAAVSLIGRRAHDASMRLQGQVWLRIMNNTVTVFDRVDYPAQCPWIEPHSSLVISGDGLYRLPGSGWQLEVRRLPDGPMPATNDVGPLSVLLAIQDGEPIELRTRRKGDRFKPHGAGGHSQKLSDTFVNMKVQAQWRDRVPLLLVDNQIAWFVAPLTEGPRSRISQSVAVTEGDQRPIWRFEYRVTPEFASG
jgi:tRNA(Ile)-lysidine synthetase-like protein